MAEDRQFETPALYTNRARVTFNPMGVRLAFGESPDGSENGEVVRAAFFMTHSMFVSLVQLLDNVHAQIEKQNTDKVDN